MAISGTPIEDGLASVSKTAQGIVQSVVPSRFSAVAGLVAERAAGAAVGGALSRVQGKVGGSENLALIQQAVTGDIKGAVLGAVTSRIAGKLKPPGASGEMIAGKVRSAEPAGRANVAEWGRVSQYLMGRIYPCDSKGNALASDPVVSVVPVAAPATDVQFEASFNWQSPFENAGPESKAPALMALIQSGQLATVASALQEKLPDVASGAGSLLEKAKEVAEGLQGRTGITKLNSRQVFSGMPPIKVTFSLHFRAIKSGQAEVMTPYQRLLEWAMPRKLAENGVFTEMLTSSRGFLDALFPSEAPTMVGFMYGNNRYVPMVIESIGNPLDGPMDENGIPIYRVVQVTLATLTALDKNDVAKIFR